MTVSVDRAATGSLAKAQAARPVLWYAALGAVFLALDLWILGSWIASPDFTPAPKGPDPIDPSLVLGAQIAQVVTMTMATAALIWFWRSSRREGRLSLPAIIGFAWFLAVWQDPLSDYLRPAFTYNAYLLNMASWGAHVPGWTSPTGGRLPEPFLYTGVMYVAIFSFIAVGIDRLFRALKARWPGLSRIQLTLIAAVVCMAADFLMETAFMRSKLYAWPGIPPGWAVFGGTPLQFPIYETLLWGPVWASTACLYAFRDAEGFTWLDKGLKRTGLTIRDNLLRVLAMLAFVNVVFLIYNIGLNLFELRAAPMPAGYESWMRESVCGPDPNYGCIGPDIPIYTVTAPPPAAAQ